MITKKEMIAQLKSEYPVLKTGNDENGYTELSNDEYELTISNWADAELAKIAEEAEIEANAAAKAALLNRLGITEDEAKLLLA